MVTSATAAALYGAIAVIGMVGNLLVVWIIPYSRLLRSTAGSLILNLAASDLIFCILDCGTTAVYAGLHYWPFGAAVCKIVNYVSSVCQYVANYTIVLICVERYHAVRKPPPAGSDTRGRYMGCLTILWAGSCAASIYIFSITEYNIKDFSYNSDMDQNQVGPFAFTESGSWTYSSSQKQGICWLTQDPAKLMAHNISTFILQYAVPSLVSLVLMVITVCGKNPAGSHTVDNEITYTAVAVVILHILMWIPSYFVGFTLMSLPDWLLLVPLRAVKLLIFFSGWLAYCSICFRPIIYAIMSKKFRREYSRVLCCKDGPQYDSCRSNQSELIQEQRMCADEAAVPSAEHVNLNINGIIVTPV